MMAVPSMAVWMAVPLGLGALTALHTRDATGSRGAEGAWYRSLRKPWWTPPRAAFPVVWTALYALMGVAAHRVWAAGGGALPLGLYAVQLALNLAWSFVFFRFQKLGWALVNVLALWVAVAATTASFYGVDTTAGHMMVPYLAWVTLATALTAHIYAANR